MVQQLVLILEKLVVEHLEQGETEFSLTTVSDKKVPVELNNDLYLTSPGAGCFYN